MENSADCAHELYSHLDSSAGDFTEFLEQLEESVQQNNSMKKAKQNIEQADTLQEESFSILDKEIFDSMEYSGGTGTYTHDVEDEINKVSNKMNESVELRSGYTHNHPMQSSIYLETRNTWQILQTKCTSYTETFIHFKNKIIVWQAQTRTASTMKGPKLEEHVK